MAYRGRQQIVTFDKGGLCGSLNANALDSAMMILPSRNIIMEQGGRRKRGGTTPLYTAAYSGTPTILGVYEASFKAGTNFILAATDDGDVYKNGTDKIATGCGTTLPYSFDTGEDKVFFADGVNSPKVWTGSGSAATVNEPASDWSSTPPFQVLKHTRGLSQRMCALNKNMLYFSKSYGSAGDMEKFITSAESMWIDSSDGGGLTGMVEHADELLVFDQKKTYRIDDSDTTTANWGVDPAQWAGGAASWRLIVKCPNDVVIMTYDGEIYSIMSAIEYGDYRYASLTRPSWMYEYIRDNINLSAISQFHGIFDPVLRAVLFFVCQKGCTTCDTALVYFIDRDPAEAWMTFSNYSSPSAYSAASSSYIRSARTVYTGDYAGKIWKTNQPDRNDNGSPYYAGFKTASVNMQDIRGRKKFDKLGVVYYPDAADCGLTVSMWVDGEPHKTSNITLSGMGAALGAFQLNVDTLGRNQLATEYTDIGAVGDRMQFEIFNTVNDEKFFLNGIILDAKPTGAQQKEGD